MGGYPRKPLLHGSERHHQTAEPRPPQAVLSTITRREWLFQMLAAGAAGCVRRDDRSASQKTTATIAYQEDVFDADYDEPDKRLVFLPLVAENQYGELEGRLAESWEHSLQHMEDLWIEG